ncbi:hypothetical protein VBD025_02810 [Virgibacillus flavescens]|uniref:hypothetical protein n=1 Tax=Virgibacillus flavescens TaxID=1611422 RepID=UPI003D339FBA
MMNGKFKLLTNVAIAVTGIIAFSNLIFFDSNQLDVLGLILFGIVTLLVVFETYKEKKIVSVFMILIFIYMFVAWGSPSI